MTTVSDLGVFFISSVRSVQPGNLVINLPNNFVTLATKQFLANANGESEGSGWDVRD